MMVEAQNHIRHLMLTQPDGKNIFFQQRGKGDLLSPYVKFSVPAAGTSEIGSVSVLGSFPQDVRFKTINTDFYPMYVSRLARDNRQISTNVTASFSAKTELNRSPTFNGFQIQK